jgi:hypothetical protein
VWYRLERVICALHLHVGGDLVIEHCEERRFCD